MGTRVTWLRRSHADGRSQPSINHHATVRATGGGFRDCLNVATELMRQCWLAQLQDGFRVKRGRCHRPEKSENDHASINAAALERLQCILAGAAMMIWSMSPSLHGRFPPFADFRFRPIPDIDRFTSRQRDVGRRSVLLTSPFGANPSHRKRQKFRGSCGSDAEA